MGQLLSIDGKMPKTRFPLLLLLLVVAGCWYYSTSGSLLPSHIKTVAVPLFENETTWEYGIKEKLTDAVIDAFTQDNTLRVESERSADSIIRASIAAIKETPFTYDREEQVQEYKMQIYLRIQFEDSLWQRHGTPHKKGHLSVS